mmetsp:Transcript_109766/g.338829  ORF Transcript_109766/g.338829 Transcript_109766/m.338829 type:complete len:236 (-) Transcript_109766:113-820(-)
MAAAPQRADGRASNQMRPPQVELRPLLRADGSGRFKLGLTAAVAAVYGPREPKFRAREVFDRAALEVLVRPRVGMPGPEERQLEGHLQRQFEHIIVLEQYPRTQISVIIQVCSEDGSVGAVAGNAAFLALLDAGVAMRATALSVSVGVQVGKQALDPATFLVDPTAEEERHCDSVVTVSVDSCREELLSSMSAGAALDAIAWTTCAKAGGKACKVLEAFLRMALQKRLETFLRPS